MNKWITLENDYLKVIISTLGAGIYQIYLKETELIPVLVTTQQAEDYYTSPNYYGKTIGRTSGRLFGPNYSIGKDTYVVSTKPTLPYMLHGGPKSIVFQVFSIESMDKDRVKLNIIDTSSESFPGDLTLSVTYQLIHQTLHIEYHGNTTKDTLCNITNHAYFNLNIANGAVLDHVLQLNASKYNVMDSEYRFIKQALVDQTPFDFKTPKSLRNGVLALKDTAQKGIDHCFILDKPGKVGSLIDPTSKRTLTVYTDYPSVVIYTHNFVSKNPLNSSVPNGLYSSVTFECQYEPDGIHHNELHSAILKKTDVYQHFIDFKFDF